MTHPHCLMTLKACTALINNKGPTVADLVEAANICRCKSCNEALERYAQIALRQKYGSEQA